jgi:hypothetical protein
MGLNKEKLTELGINEEAAQEILKIHWSVVDGMKGRIEELRNSADRVPALKKELEQLKTENQTSSEYKTKYEQEKHNFEEFKREIEVKKANSTKDKLYRKLLSENNVKANKIDLIMRTVNLNDLELDGEDKLKGSEDLNKEILKDWQDFIETTEVQGANTATPPYQSAQDVDLGSLSMEDYIKARQNK